MTFFGASRAAQAEPEHAIEAPAGHGHGPAHGYAPHESPWIMLLPLVLLAILSVGGGWLGVPQALGGSDRIAAFLEPVFALPRHSYEELSIQMNVEGLQAAVDASAAQPPAPPAGNPGQERLFGGLSILAAAIGWFFADLFYRRKPGLPAQLVENARGAYSLLVHKYWIDEIYSGVIVTPLLLFSRYFLRAGVDRGVIDGGGQVVAIGTRGIGALVQRVQSGNIRSYAGWLAVGAAALLLLSHFGFALRF
jgi:NADH-quinone oxidoreductase subunit L